MRHLLLLVTLILLGSLQSLTAQGIIKAEYFIGSDPGAGKATPIAITPGEDIETNFNFSTEGLSVGFHSIVARVLNDTGLWSEPLKADFYVYDTTLIREDSEASNISEIEYYIDSDEGAGTGEGIIITPGETVDTSIQIDIPELDYGFHKIMLRGRNEDGYWGEPIMTYFFVYDTTYTPLDQGSSLVTAEYFFDNSDTEQGKGISILLDSTYDVNYHGDIPLSDLDTGFHQLYVRVRDGNNLWSSPMSTDFFIGDWNVTTNSPICYDYNNGMGYINLKSGSLPFTYLWSDTEQQTNDTATYLTPGKYYVTARDANGVLFRDSILIEEFDSIGVEMLTIDTDCNTAEGAISAIASGSFPPFIYEWSTASSEATIRNLESGAYYLEVTDQEGCSRLLSSSVVDVNGPEVIIKSIRHVSCFGGLDAILDISVSGGQAPYTYQWSNGDNNQDLLNIPAGVYELDVTDANGCKTIKKFEVKQPYPLIMSFEAESADCGLNNGQATVYVTGGTKPYKYLWDGGGTTAENIGMGLGIHSVAVSDNKNCTSSEQIVINERGAPDVSVVSILNATCGNADGTIFTSLSGNPDHYIYLWSDGSAEQHLSGATPGNYSLSVTDTLGCTSITAVRLPVVQPDVAPICLVTVDSAENYNMVVWEKPLKEGIKYFNVYRESSEFGKYDKIGQVDVTNESLFLDRLSNPSIRAYKYKLSVVDTCDIESNLSEAHKTIHLSMNVGLNDVINLAWNNYEGFPVSTYMIWRYDQVNGWTMIEELSSDNTSYTDGSPPPGFLEYYIEVLHPTGCSSSKKKARTLNTSRSNRESKMKSEATSFSSMLESGLDISLFPNPNQGLFSTIISSKTTEKVKVEIVNSLGKIISNEELLLMPGLNYHDFNIQNYSDGFYFIRIITNQGILNKKFILHR